MASPKEAFQSEYVGKFLKAEEKHRDRTAEAYNNSGSEGFQWYEEPGGPVEEHEFSRSEMDSAISQTTNSPERMFKNAADQIAAMERACMVRRESRIALMVRARVRQDQIKLACTFMKNILEDETA